MSSPGMGLIAIFAVLVATGSVIDGAEEPDLLFTVDSPILIENVTEDFTMDCRPSNSLVEGGISSLLVDIFKNDGSGDVFVARQRIKTTVDEDERISASGHMKTVGDEKSTFLSVSVTNPSFSDEGMYTCRFVYMDSKFQIHHMTSSINVTVEDLPPPVVIVPEVQADKVDDVIGCKCDDAEIWKEIKSLKASLVLENQILKDEIQKYNDSEGVQVQEPKKRVTAEDDTCKVSFSAKMSGDSPLVSDVMITFDDVISNKGDAFKPESSAFVAPCDGQYFFSLTLRSQQKLDSGYVDGLILVDGEEVARTSVFIGQPVTNYQSATNGAVVTLTQGQEVNVKVKTTSAGKLKSSTYSVFSGFYLFR